MAPLNLELIILGKVLIAAVLGAAVGLERELLGKPAGLRTHTIVAAAAALLVGITPILTAEFVETFSPSNNATVRADPLSIIEAIIVGISFLGAGIIIQQKSGEDVINLTTSASLLLVAGIGITVALDAYYLSAGVTLLTLIVQRGLGWLEHRFIDKRK